MNDRAGRRGLRHVVSLEREDRTPDGAGGYALAWVKVATLRADIRALDGREIVHAGQIEARVTHRVTIRYRSGVAAAMRLRFRGRILNIRAAIDPGERGRWLELLCEEGVAT